MSTSSDLRTLLSCNRRQCPLDSNSRSPAWESSNSANPFIFHDAFRKWFPLVFFPPFNYDIHSCRKIILNIRTGDFIQAVGGIIHASQCGGKHLRYLKSLRTQARGKPSARELGWKSSLNYQLSGPDRTITLKRNSSTPPRQSPSVS